MKAILFPLFATLLLASCGSVENKKQDAVLALSSNEAELTKTNGESLHWMSITEAVAAQATSPKKILMDIYTQWCGPCKLMSSKTFEDKDVVAYLSEHYYCVKFDAESGDSLEFKGVTYKNPDFKPNTPGRNGVHQFSRYMNVTAYPTLVFLDEKADYIGPVVGYKTPAQLEIFVKLFAEDKHKEILTTEQWQEYQEKFVTTWSNK